MLCAEPLALPKPRSNSHGDAPPPVRERRSSSSGSSTDAYALRRAASSEAKIPSPTAADEPDGDGRSFRSCQSSSHQAHEFQQQQQQQQQQPQPQQPQQPQQQPSSYQSHESPHLRHAATNGSNLRGSWTGQKRLQTIESGIALADQAGGTAAGANGASSASAAASSSRSPTRDSSPKPPVHPSPGGPQHHGHGHRSGGSLPPLLPQIYQDPQPSQGRGGLPRPDVRRDRLQSDQTAGSHYSIDAGKHGFLGHPNANAPLRTISGGDHGGDGWDADSVGANSTGANSANDSVVFKYLPGQETPPAEYALPATILGVYGDRCAEEEAYYGHARGSGPRPGREGGDGIEATNWRRGAMSDGVDASSSIACSPDSEPEEDEEGGGRGPREGAPRSSPRGPGISSPVHGQTMRVPTLPGPWAPNPGDANEEAAIGPRVLPYHERKRLAEQEEEERRRRHAARLREELDRLNGIDNERTPLNGRREGNEDESAGWFGKLVSLVAGAQKPQTAKLEEEQGRRKGRKHRDCDRGVEDETESFRNRGKAFLKKTEKERKQMQEQNRIEERNNVHIPVAKQSFGPKPPNRHSTVSALDSIASCSEDDESDGDEEGSTTETSDDEESPSPRVREQRVWKYGEPPTVPPTAHGAPPPARKKRGAKSSERDGRLRRERLLQEEYEYRLRTLRQENEHLSKRFRIFVLVAVAVVFAGAMGFALVVCVRMLMSI